jgi:hypothetical protein
LNNWRLRPAFLAEICKQKEKSGEALFARIEQLVDQVPVLVYRGTRAGLSRIESSGDVG